MTDARITDVAARAFRIPTDSPEADGTLEWDATTLVVVEIGAGGTVGLGYSYADGTATDIVTKVLAQVLFGQDAFAIQKLWLEMTRAVRNIGWSGVCSCAISAVDVALWDLKARLLDLPLTTLLGLERDDVAIYGSGGFTTYSPERLGAQLAAWVERDGCRWVKMKVGAAPDEDLGRARTARKAIGGASLYVDANGAYDRKQALELAAGFADIGVRWFEEPVSSDDLEGLRLMRDRAPAGMEIAAGEYGYTPFYFKRMLEVGAVDVLQADATRCGGYTGFLKAASLADASVVSLSSHAAPALHLPVCCAAPRVRHMEWFYDHVRIEHMMFDGAPVAKDGRIRPDLSRPGHGLMLRRKDAERFAAVE